MFSLCLLCYWEIRFKPFRVVSSALLNGHSCIFSSDAHHRIDQHDGNTHHCWYLFASVISYRIQIFDVSNDCSCHANTNEILIAFGLFVCIKISQVSLWLWRICSLYGNLPVAYSVAQRWELDKTSKTKAHQ